MSVWGYVLGLAVAFGVGVLLATVWQISSRDGECDECSEACAWRYVRGCLLAVGWADVTPELVVKAAADTFSKRISG